MTIQLARCCAAVLLGLGLTFGYAQETINATGGNASGSGGAVSYSVGILAYTSASGADGSVAQGVQHAYEIYSVSIEDHLYDFALKAFPNPTTDFLMLEVGNFNSRELAFQLLDMRGQVLRKDAIQSTQTQLDFSSLSSGVYLLQIYDSKQSIHTFKITKH
jgi:hypothetical protein